MGTLILVRHGESIANKERFFSGTIDSPLSSEGEAQAAQAATQLRGQHIDVAFTSRLCRAEQTLSIILDTLGLTLPITRDAALNERDFGVLQGRSYDECERQYGEDAINRWRSDADPSIGGESFADVIARVSAYFEREIAPLLRDGKAVLIVAHNQVLRGLLSHLGTPVEGKILKNAMVIVRDYP